MHMPVRWNKKAVAARDGYESERRQLQQRAWPALRTLEPVQGRSELRATENRLIPA
jgi:hypothetical protein